MSFCVLVELAGEEVKQLIGTGCIKSIHFSIKK